jgi:hypothetical protein
MSNLQEFFRSAKTETEEQRFQRDYDAGLIPIEQLLGLVGNRRSPLAVPYHFRTDQDWYDYYSKLEIDYDRKPEPPPLS